LIFVSCIDCPCCDIYSSVQDSNVIVLANLKPRNMCGIKSNGMLMAASDASHENVELLTPPEGSVPGERVWFGSEDRKDCQSDPASPNQVPLNSVDLTFN
jgi:aminoacyl tRNA synthase complex-interacting multifunctional protein 1